MDIEADTKKIYELGMVYKGRSHNTPAIEEATNFMKLCGSSYICGHNIIDFDREILKDTTLYHAFRFHKFIDTLPLSLLLFNEKTIHKLPKNYKTEDDFRNDPVEDCKLTAKLLNDSIDRFLSLDEIAKSILYQLLKESRYFENFFDYLIYRDHISPIEMNPEELLDMISKKYDGIIINIEYLKEVIESHPVELAYIISLITPHIEIKSLPPKILYDYPNIVEIQKKLSFDIDRSKESLSDIAKEIFGFSTFRPFPKLNPTLLSTEVSQRDIIEASLNDDSFLAVLPTGGGKTFTFWLPAIIKAKSYKSLTVVISPLQALIEDHISNFNEKVDNYKAVAISGYMSPLERSEAVEFVINGEADILYLAPESLRSNMIFNILKNRYIERFVIDEAHCLSTWGSDFRQDYYYICDYIKDLLDKKSFQDHIPISCFTATAKPSVIDDIKKFFLDGLDIELGEYIATPQRKNLRYKSIPSDKKDKYRELLKLINEHNGSTLIYIPSSTKECDSVADKLRLDTNKEVKSFHSKLESQEKMAILKDYILNDIDVIVATTAFGMGVDKADITNVIHYEMSDSLESYAQEAGRGARDERLEAFCPILYDENDLDKHFTTLNRSKITASEINSIFRVIKKSRGETITKTLFEIALEAGWDVEDSSSDYATKVKTALLELEREEYISRDRNRVRFFADSIARDSMAKLHSHIDSRDDMEESEKDRLIIVLQSILGRGKVESVQVDELAHLLGYDKSDISLSINQLKDMEILGNSRDLSLTIYIDAKRELLEIRDIEEKLFEYLKHSLTQRVTIKELNEYIQQHSSHKSNKNRATTIKELLKNLREKNLFIFKRINRQNDQWYFEIIDQQELEKKLSDRYNIAQKVIEIFTKEIEDGKKEARVEFSLKDIRQKIGTNYSIKDIDHTLLYLHHLHIVELLNGRFISYSPIEITKKEKMNIRGKKYSLLDYRNRLAPHYRTKIEAIHIMGEYGRLLQSDDHKASMFLKDYFTMPYDKFKRHYKLLKEKITRPITQKRYDKIFKEMSDEQKSIIENRETKAMMILAGPGSGKTKVLVHKIASLILTEDIKPEQFMMLTFSRSASAEFRSRLHKLMGVLSYDIEISTFHAYALKLIARVGGDNQDILNESIKEATKQIVSKEIELPYIRVLVLDEFQDITQDSFDFVRAIYDANAQETKIIAVGDDDQCIMGFNGADVAFIDKFEETFGRDDDGNSSFKKYELLTNFRSKRAIVEYSNEFTNHIKHRYKKDPLHANSRDDGLVTVQTCISKDLISPAIDIIKESDKSSTIAVLAYTNDEVLQLYSQLNSIGIEARYILDREKFHLKNIVEIVEFDKTLNSMQQQDHIYTIDNFYRAMAEIEERFEHSKNLPLLKRVVDRFLNENQEYYISQWLIYLDEVKLEEFSGHHNTILLSTIHKSKGMEFDKVILIIKNTPKADEEFRKYYVGMTRAKDELIILREGSKNLSKINTVANYIFNDKIYQDRNRVVTLVMGLGDIYLGDNRAINNHSNFMLSGDIVKLQPSSSSNSISIMHNNIVIGSLSKKFHSEIIGYQKRGYHIDSASIDFLVYWYDKKNKRYVLLPLCKIVLLLSQ